MDQLWKPPVLVLLWQTEQSPVVTIWVVPEVVFVQIGVPAVLVNAVPPWQLLHAAVFAAEWAIVHVRNPPAA
jgi:hypothetical protein